MWILDPQKITQGRAGALRSAGEAIQSREEPYRVVANTANSKHVSVRRLEVAAARRSHSRFPLCRGLFHTSKIKH